MRKNSILFCILIAISSVCQAEESTSPTEQAPQWMLKVGADFFDVDNDLPGIFGWNTPNPNFDIYGLSTNVEGTLYGATASIGRVVDLWHPAMLTLDLSKRSGDLSATVSRDSDGVAVGSFDVDREDQEYTLTYQIISERWQPFLTLTYWDMEQSYHGLIQPSNDLFEFSSFNVGAGLGVNFGQVWKARFGAKASGEIMLVDGKWTNKDTGELGIDDNTHGVRWKGTLIMNIPFEFSEFIGGFFAEGGYQYQRADFDQVDGNANLSMDWDGFYGRTGIFFMF